MLQNTLRKTLAAIAMTLSVSALVLAGCSGGDTDGEGNSNNGTGNQFVGDGGAGATIKIIADDTIGVSDVKGFFVEVLDPRGAPLSYVRVFCESEKGIAIIEPSSGGVAFEHTGPDGKMSGKIGGLTPGSYIMECRAPEGFGLVARKSIKVTGSVPAGFTGFPGAAGGNLGGGFLVDLTPDDAVRSTTITFTDAGGESVSGPIDTSFNANCDGDAATVDPEPFTDTTYSITLRNDLQQRLTVTSVKFTINDGAGSETSTQSVTVEIPKGSSGTVTGILITFTTGGNQVYAGTGDAVVDGTHQITAVITGVLEDGTAVTLNESSTITLRPVNNCGT